MPKCYNSENQILDLPLEILEYILRYLSVSDQISFGATCRYFYEITCSMKFCDRLKIVLCKDKMEPKQALIKVIEKSTKKFHHYHFEQVEFEDKLHKFWQTFGPDIHSLYLMRCDLQEKSLVEILRECIFLEELHIVACHEILMSGRLLESKDERSILKGCLKHLKLLDLSRNRYLSDALFTRLANLTNSIHSLFLNGCNISFHKGLCRKFYPSQNFDVPSESVLTFRFILEFIRIQAFTVKKLDFSSTLIDGLALSLLAEVEGLQLNSLKLQQCDQITNTGMLDLLNKQKNLVELDCSYCSRMTDQSLIAICNNLPNLRKLYIRRCRVLTDTGIRDIDKLTNLEVLDMSECGIFITSKGVENAICTKYNENLKELYLNGLDIKENVVISITDKLPNLRVLDLSGCGNAVTDHSIQYIFYKFQWLRELKLEHCFAITDAGLTGINSTTVDDNALDLYGMCYSSMKENMSKTENFNKDESMKCVNTIAQLQGLTVLKLQGCKLTDLSLRVFKFSELRKLSINRCTEFTLSGFEHLVKYCPAIECLNLEGGLIITDDIVLCIVKNLKRLKVLILDSCKKLNRSMDFILQYGKSLKYLSFSGCESLNLEKLDELNSEGQNCIIEHANWKSSEFAALEYIF